MPAGATAITHAPPGPWLAAAGKAAAGVSRVAAAFTALDSVGAIGFAAGLAMVVAALPSGLAAALPGAALALASGLARGLFAFSATTAGAHAAAKVKVQTRDRIVRASLLTPPGDQRPLGERLALVVDGVESLDGWFARFAPARSAAASAPIFVMAAMAVASPVSAGIVLCTFIPFVTVMVLAGGAAAEVSRRQFDALNRLSGLFVDRLRVLPLVLAFGAEARSAAVVHEASHSVAHRTLDVLKIAFVSSAALDFFAALSVALVAVYCGFNLLHLLPFPVPERLDLGRAVFVLALAPEAYTPLRRLAAVYHDRQAAETAAESLANAQRASAPRAPTWLAHPPDLRFDRVTVRYDGEERAALMDFDLTIAQGEVVALVGPSGAGKSTILNLLLGLARATDGAIFLDGELFDPTRPPRSAWAGQAPIVIPGTLAENIAFARQDASAREIARALSLSGLGSLGGAIERIIDERGGGLSGGERRRLGLARAILSDAPLLLLDEPTANLDAASEAALLPVLREMVHGRTALIATHSQAVAGLAHRIIRLES